MFVSCIHPTRWGSSAEMEKEAISLITKGKNRFLRNDGFETAMVQHER